jgi:predicted nucleotidyltransferase
MVTRREIESLATRLAAEFCPERVVLFGSYAYGMPNEDSDVDLLVVMPFVGASHKKAAQMSLSLRPSFPVDILVRTEAQLRERIRLGDCFLKEIISNGVVLYEADDEGMGGKGRGGLQRPARAKSRA